MGGRAIQPFVEQEDAELHPSCISGKPWQWRYLSRLDLPGFRMSLHAWS